MATNSVVVREVLLLLLQLSPQLANPVSGGAKPSRTQNGLVANWNNFASPVAGQGCYGFATSHNITTNRLYAWNPALGLNGAGCATALWASEYCCIVTWSTSATVVTPPSATRPGIIASCNNYAVIIKDDSCDMFAWHNFISNAQLYAWSSVLGTTGQNCSTLLWAESYCVGISAGPVSSVAITTAKPTCSSSSTVKSITMSSNPPTSTIKSTATTSKATTTSQVTPAEPTQTGIVSNCDKVATPATGQGCYDFTVGQGNTPPNLYKWNTVLGPNGENCGSFWYTEYYCVVSVHKIYCTRQYVTKPDD